MVEDLVDGKLPESEYVSVAAPKADIKADAPAGIKAVSVRSNRDNTASWARKAFSSKSAKNGITLKARRIIVFIVGGVTHSEVRVAHQLSKKLKRDVLLGGTSIDNPATFLEKLHHLSASDAQHHE